MLKRLSAMRFLIIFSILITLIYSCRRNQILTDESIQLSFSTDTVLLDTIFTTFNSSTKSFKIYNNDNRDIQINQIYLGGGNLSPFRINVDGIHGHTVNDLVIRGKDSAFVFVELTVEDLDANEPFIIQDSILFNINNQSELQKMPLVSWGQDAHYYSTLAGNNIIRSDTTWTNDKPHVIFGQLWIDSLARLTIEEGTQIHVHNNSVFGIYRDGQLTVNGSSENPVVFQGTRLEFDYSEIPGQWRGIFLHRLSTNNEFNYTVIKNASIGIQIDQLPSELENIGIFNQPNSPNLTLNNCHIRNITSIGLWGIAGNINAYNSIFSNCGQHLAALSWGGRYEFLHCTFANYWTYNFRETPAMIINDFHPYVNVELNPFDDQSIIGNSIIIGSLENELALSFEERDNFTGRFDHVIARTDTAFKTDYGLGVFNSFTNNLLSFDNFFQNTEDDYRLTSNSPAIDSGDIQLNQNQSILNTDYDQNPRSTPVDLGAFEFIE